MLKSFPDCNSGIRIDATSPQQNYKGAERHKPMSVNYRVSLDFANYGDSDLDEFAANVVTCLTGNPAFPTPPVLPPALGALNDAYRAAILAAVLGGQQLKAAKNAARVPVVGALRQNAAYVQIHASQNLEVLLTSGFYANSINRAQSPLTQPVILTIENNAATQLIVRVGPVTNARSYQVRLMLGSNPPVDGGIFTQARGIVLTNLASAATYVIQVRAIGGSTGYSEWSMAVPHIVT